MHDRNPTLPRPHVLAAFREPMDLISRHRFSMGRVARVALEMAEQMAADLASSPEPSRRAWRQTICEGWPPVPQLAAAAAWPQRSGAQILQGRSYSYVRPQRVFAGMALTNIAIQGPWSSSNFWVTLAVYLVVGAVGYALIWYLLPGMYDEKTSN